MTVTLYHRYCKLDQCHYYQVVSEGGNDYFRQWLWYGIGQAMKGYERLWQIVPYKHDFNGNKIRKLKEYKPIDATECGVRLVKAMHAHYKKQKV